MPRAKKLDPIQQAMVLGEQSTGEVLNPAITREELWLKQKKAIVSSIKAHAKRAAKKAKAKKPKFKKSQPSPKRSAPNYQTAD
jgi:hypothetical protein